MSYTITSTVTNITMTGAYVTSQSITKNVENYLFTDMTDEQLDAGKSSHTLRIIGTEYTDAFATIRYINSIVDAGVSITISGFDSDLNTDYHIKEFSYNEDEGETGVYHYTMILERLHDY